MNNQSINNNPGFASDKADKLTSDLIDAAKKSDVATMSSVLSENISTAISSGYYVDFLEIMLEKLAVRLDIAQEYYEVEAAPTSAMVPDAEFNQKVADAALQGNSELLLQLLQEDFKRMAGQNNYNDKFDLNDPNVLRLLVSNYILVTLASLAAAYEQ